MNAIPCQMCEHPNACRMSVKECKWPPSDAAVKVEPVACVNCGGTKAPHALDPYWRGRCECAFVGQEAMKAEPILRVKVNGPMWLDATQAEFDKSTIRRIVYTAPQAPTAEPDFIDITDMLKLESMKPVEGLDEIMKHYETTFGRTPDAFMGKVVAETKERLLMWWAIHRDAIRAALVVAEKDQTNEQGRAADVAVSYRDYAAGFPLRMKRLQKVVDGSTPLDGTLIMVKDLQQLLTLAQPPSASPVAVPEAWRIGLLGVKERLSGCVDPYLSTKPFSAYRNGEQASLLQALAEIEEVLQGTSPGMACLVRPALPNGAGLDSPRVEIRSQDANQFEAVYTILEPSEYLIIATRDDENAPWYIDMRHPDGGHTYDGEWHNSAGKSVAEVITEALRGSELQDATPQALPVAVGGETDLNLICGACDNRHSAQEMADCPHGRFCGAKGKKP